MPPPQSISVLQLRRLGATDMVAAWLAQGYASSTVGAKLRQAFPGSPPGVRAAIFREGRREWEASVGYAGLNQFAHAWQTRWRQRNQPNRYEYVVVVQGIAGAGTGQRRLTKVTSSVELRKWELNREAQRSILIATGGAQPGFGLDKGLAGGPTTWVTV